MILKLNKEAKKQWLEEKETIEFSCQCEVYGYEEDGNTPKGEKICVDDDTAMRYLIKMARSSDFYDYDYGLYYLGEKEDEKCQ
jgi:hypothetical protein